MEQKDFFDFLRKLEAFKVRFKELHWNAGNTALHKLCDQVLDFLGEFQDEFAESGFIQFGKFSAGEFNAPTDLIVSETLKETLKELFSTIIDVKGLTAPDEKRQPDFSALTDTAITEVKRLIYLYCLEDKQAQIEFKTLFNF